MNKIHYRSAIISQGAGGNIVMNIGYPPLVTPPTTSYLAIEEKITSLNTAIARGMSFLRRFQANGFDTRLEVLGEVLDDNNYQGNVLLPLDPTVFVNSGKALPTVPVRALAGAVLLPVPLPAESSEQMYARIDTPERGLTTRIALSNRSAITGSLGNLGGDFLEDTNDKSTLLLEGI